MAQFRTRRWPHRCLARGVKKCYRQGDAELEMDGGRLRTDDGVLSRNLTDNSSEGNELHVESGGLFCDSL
jgi:hypothetical protein